MASDDLGSMMVSFEADLSGLLSGQQQFISIIDSMMSAADNMSSQFADLPALNAENLVAGAPEAEDQLMQVGQAATDMADTLATSSSFDASGIVDGAAQADSALSGLSDQASQAEESVSGVDDASSSAGSGGFQSLISGIGGAASGFMNFLPQVGQAAMNLGGDLVDGLGSAASGFIDFIPQVASAASGLFSFAQTALQTANALLAPAAQAEQTQVAFDTLTGSASKAATMMDQLNTFAAKTPFQTQDIDTAAEKLLAFGINGQSVIPDITGIGDSLSALGRATPTDLNSIVDIFGKIQASGKLTAADMTQMSTYGIPSWKALSDAMGVPITTLQSMVSKGLVPASQALPDLQKGMEDVFGGGMAKQADTFTGLMSTLKSNVTLAMAAFGTPLLKMAEGSLTNIGNVLSSKSFQTFATDTGEKIGKVIQNIGEFASNPAFQKFGELLGGAVLTGLEKVLDALASPQFGAFMKTMGDDLVTAIKLSEPYIVDIADAIMTFAENIDKKVQPIIEGFMKWWTVAWPGIAIVLKGVWDQIQGVVEIAWSLVSGIIEIGLDLLSGNWKGAWNDLVNMVDGILHGLGMIVQGGLEQLVGIIGIVGASIANALNWPFQSAWNFISGIIGDIQNGIGSISSTVSGGLNALHIPGFASGTNSAPGGLSLVGENGPELVNLPQGAQVIPLQGGGVSMGALAGGSGGQEIHVHNHIHIDGQEMTNVLMNNAVNMIRATGPVGKVA